MDFDFYVKDGAKFVSKKTLSEKYNKSISTIILLLSNTEMETVLIGRETFYRCSEVSKFLNDKLHQDLDWKYTNKEVIKK